MKSIEITNTAIRSAHAAKPGWKYTVIALACILMTGAGVRAQNTETWDNGSGNFLWDTTSVNWSGTTWVDGSSASFGGSAGPINVVGTRTLDNLTISGTGFSFTNGDLNVTNLNSGANTIWAFDTGVGNPNFYSAVTFTLSGSAMFEKEGGASGAGESFYGGVTGNGDTNTGSFFTITGTSGVGNFFRSSVNLTNVMLLASTGCGVYITSGTNTMIGQTESISRCGLGINGGSHVYYWGGYSTVSELNVEYGTSGSYIQTNGTMIVLGNSGSGAPYSVGIEFGCNGGSGQTATLELDGGLLSALGAGRTTNYVFPGVGTIKLDGGTFQCMGDNTNLFDVGSNPSSSILIGQTPVGTLTNGATIDTAGYYVTELEALHAGTPSGGLATYGGGTLDLAGANTYTGPTVVSNGTLLVDGSLAAASTVEAALGGTIGGGGTINGPVTVDSGGTIAPGNSALGTLTVDNNLTLDSGAGAVFRLDSTNSPTTSDYLDVSGTQSISGSTLTVVNVGPALQAGDSFTLLSQPTAGFTTVNLPAGYTWTNNLATDGSIEVTSVVAPTPSNISYSVNGNQLVLNWPSAQGWQLQAQTNSLAVGLSSNWVNVTGATPPFTNTINPANAVVLYRLVNQ